MSNQSTDGAGSNNRLLITLNRIVAVLSILAALLLYTGAEPLGVPGLGAAPHHEPIIVHCLLTALLLFGANARLIGVARPDLNAKWFHILSALICGAFVLINLFLAGEAALNLSAATAPALLLVVPGILNGWNFFALLSDDDERPTAADVPPDMRVFQAVEESRATPGATFRRELARGLSVVAVLGAMFITITLTIPYYVMLERVIFEQSFMGWETFFLLIIPDVIATMFPSFLPLVVFFFGLFAVIGGYMALRERHDQRHHRNFNRDLESHEIEVIDKATRQFIDFAESIENRQVYNSVTGLIVLFSIGTLIGFVFVVNDTGFAAGYFKAARTQGLDWYLYKDEVGLGDVLLIFSILLVLGGLWTVIGSFWRAYGVSAILNFRRIKDDPYSAYRRMIALDVRRGLLTLDSKFDPVDYVGRDFDRFARKWRFVAVGVVAVNLVFLYLDRMDYDLLTEEYIEYTDYWTSKVYRMGYEDVDRVEVVCSWSKGFGIDLSYRLKFGGSRTIKIAQVDTPRELRTVARRRLDDWTRADAKLRAAGVPVYHAIKQTKRGGQTRFSERDCRAGLDQLVGPAVRKKIMPLLRESGAPQARPPRPGTTK